MNTNKRLPGKDSSVFIIAEIGTSHGGSLEKASDLIHAARDAGADCVKFQYVIADEIVHPSAGTIDLPGGPVSIYSRFKELEQPEEFYEKLKLLSEDSGLIFLCSPFGIKSAGILKSMDVDAIKIASPELNHYPLIEEAGSFPLIISTGVSTLDDIARTLEYCHEETAILHCITSYPAPETEYNLSVIRNLEAVFNRKTGVSDHSTDPVLVPSMAASLKAYAIEKHITLSNDTGGLDDAIALNPGNFKKMCSRIRLAEKEGYNETLARLLKEFDADTVFRTVGDGVKKLAPSEKGNYRTTNRSIIAVRDIHKGECFTEENIALLRSEKNLEPGLPPEFYRIILGKKAGTDIPSSRGITKDCL